MLFWPLHFPTLLIRDGKNAGNLIFPAILDELQAKGKIKEQSEGVVFHYLNRFMPRRLYFSSCDVRNLAPCAYLSLQYHIRQCILILLTV